MREGGRENPEAHTPGFHSLTDMPVASGGLPMGSLCVLMAQGLPYFRSHDPEKEQSLK